MERIVLKNGMIYDGTGSAPFKGDVLIAGDTIEQVGKGLVPEGTGQVFELDGLAVTPGFIDMHRHCDKNPFEQRGDNRDYGTALLRQGITTVVTGNCGISMYPLNKDPEIVRQMWDYYAPVLGNLEEFSAVTSYAGYISRLRGCSLPVNTAAMIGMGAVRIAVKGFSPEPLTKEEMIQCRELVENALALGAPGVSIGLMYLPECYSTAEELGEILKPVKQYNRIVTAHIRGEGDSLVKSVEEVIRIGKLAGCRMEISHFKSCGVNNWNREIFRAIERMEKAQESGQEIDCDFYPYDCGSTTLMSMIPPDFTHGDIPGALKRLETEEGKNLLRKMLRASYPDWDNYACSLGWDKVILSSAERKEHQGKIGKSIAEIAEEFGYRDEVEAAAHILTSEHGKAAIIIRSMSQQDIDVIAKLPGSCLISDAIYAETDRPHPRMYGAFPRMIADYVKRRNVLSLEKAIQKMTSMPAERMGISRRGKIREGCFADINVFDPDKFQDRATYTQPVQYAQNLTYCFINGKIAVKEDKICNREAGRVL